PMPDGRIACAGDVAGLSVLDLASGRLRIVNGDPYDVTALAVLPDGRIVAGEAGAVKVRYPPNSVRDVSSVHHGGAVRALAALSDGRIASAGGNTIMVWDPNSERLPLSHEAGRFTTLAALPDGRVAYGIGQDGEVRVWD